MTTNISAAFAFVFKANAHSVNVTTQVAEPKTAEAKGGAGPELPTKSATDSTIPASSSDSSVSLPATSSALDARIQGLRGHSIGDPHVRTGDGLDFDNMREGKFIKAKSESGDFEVQTEQTKPNPDQNVTVNTAAAVKAGKDVVNFNAATNQLTVNGEAKTLNDGETVNLPDGGKLSRKGNDYHVETAKGDKVEMQNKGGYMDVYTDVSPDRKAGEVRGELGNFDADTDKSNDLVGRNGENLNGDVEKFLDNWTVKDGESLFDAKGGAQPADKAAEQPAGGAAPAEAANNANNAEQGAGNAQLETALKDFLGKLSPEDQKMFGDFFKSLMGALGGAQNQAQAPAAGDAAKAAEPTAGAAEPAKAEDNQAAAQQPQQQAEQPAEKQEDDGFGDITKIFEMLMNFIKAFQGQAAQAAPAADAQKAA